MIKTSKKLLIFLLAAIMMQSCSSGTVDETTKAGTESGKTETTAESESETETEPEETYTDDIWGPNLLRSIVTASDQSYDIVTMLDRFSLSALSEKLIVSYQDLPNIDLTKDCWGGNMLKDSSIGGVNYFAFGDFSLYAMDNISTLLFNQNVASQNGINDLYDLVESKK